MAKETKTNAIRIIEKFNISFKVNNYICDEFVDAIKIADMLSQPYESSYKTLVAQGRSTRNYYVFCVPIAEELDLKKAAKCVSEKSIALIHVKDINAVTGYIRGGCTPIGMKKKYQTVIDATAEKFDEIIISGGRIGTQILLNPNDLVRVTDGCYQDIIVSTDEEIDNG